MTQHLHILGVAGTFMTGLSIIAKQLGFKVTGTDYKIYPPMSDILSAENIKCLPGYDNPENREYINKADCIIIGNALSRGNPCVEYILENKKNFKSGPQWLYENVLKNKWVLAVSGTHGKTTTSSMLAWILEYNQINPGFLIGGLANNFNSSAQASASKYFVIEADEYDTAFYDKRPKFLHYFPSTLIINNIEFDHADIYSNISAIEQQFGYLLRTVPQENGCVITHRDLENNFTLDSENIYKYGVGNKVALNLKYFTILDAKSENTNTYNPINTPQLCAQLKEADGRVFDCYYNNQFQGTVDYKLLGEHNVNNSLAAILAANSIGITIPDAIAALCQFQGVARRLEEKGQVENILIFDDFAHHPTAIKTTLMGLRKSYIDNPLAYSHANSKKHNRLIAILDFSSYSMRTKVHSDKDFLDALSVADIVYFYQAAGMGWDCEDLLKQYTATQKQGFLYKTSQDLIANLANNTLDGDIIVFMTKSAFNSNIQTLVDKLKERIVTKVV